MNKFGLALELLVKKHSISKNRLETEGKLKRSTLNQSIAGKRAPRADKIDLYLKAFNLTWNDFADALMKAEAIWQEIEIQPAQRKRILVGGQEIDIDKLELPTPPAREKRKIKIQPRDGPSPKKTAHKKYSSAS